MLTRDIPYQSEYADHPAIPGESSTTGRPYDGVYVPLLIVYDNAQKARPLVGIAQADIVFQMPNAGAGATKLLGLFADTIPLQAGNIRSARVPYIELREIWDAALIYNGGPTKGTYDALDINRSLRGFDVYGKGLSINIISAQQRYQSAVEGKHSAFNAMADLQTIKADLLADGHQFAEKPFLFTDELPTGGVAATDIEIAHFSNTFKNEDGNAASWARYVYNTEQNAYARTVDTGVFSDFYAPDTALLYNNLIVVRTKYRYLGNYVLLEEFTGQGAADIFIGGRYIEGGWVRSSLDSRIIIVDETGAELALQRGTTMFVVAHENTRVSFSAGE